MPAQIIVTRMPRADVEKKIAELQAGDVLAIVPNDGGKGCLVQSKIPVVRRGPELDRAYQLLQAIADADDAIGQQRRAAREAKEAAAGGAKPAQPAQPTAPKKPGQKPGISG